jgi:hypothetical protein
VGLRSLPCTEASSKCAVQSSAAALVRHSLLPHGDKLAVVAMLVGELCAQGNVGGGRGPAGALVGIGRGASAGAFEGHGGTVAAWSELWIAGCGMWVVDMSKCHG